ncbi:hypothetical protein I547_2891 [Mycobacterium kansasii 824]|nr:hypothetical protein I547_2891 [Mycobacterium kansasii 824]
MIAAPNQVQRVLGSAAQLLEFRFRTTARGAVRIEPTTDHAGVQLRSAGSRHWLHTRSRLGELHSQAAW